MKAGIGFAELTANKQHKTSIYISEVAEAGSVVPRKHGVRS